MGHDGVEWSILLCEAIQLVHKDVIESCFHVLSIHPWGIKRRDSSRSQ